MVMPLAPEPCPQCGADTGTSEARCKSCGFWLPAAPPLRTRPPTARPLRRQAEGRRALALVLGFGGVLVLALGGVGAFVWLRASSPTAAAPAPSSGPLAAPPSAVAARLDPSSVLPNARRLASSWHPDAALIGISAGPLDERGLTPEGALELSYARPSGRQITAGAETSAEQLLVRAVAERLTSQEQRGNRARAVPEPNCLFEDAVSTARRAGISAGSRVRLRYLWSEKHARPVWQVWNEAGTSELLRTLDGVSCAILMR